MLVCLSKGWVSLMQRLVNGGTGPSRGYCPKVWPNRDQAWSRVAQDFAGMGTMITIAGNVGVISPEFDR